MMHGVRKLVRDGKEKAPAITNMDLQGKIWNTPQIRWGKMLALFRKLKKTPIFRSDHPNIRPWSSLLIFTYCYRQGEVPSANGNCSARGLARIAAAMAGRGSLDEVRRTQVFKVRYVSQSRVLKLIFYQFYKNLCSDVCVITQAIQPNQTLSSYTQALT